MYGQWAQDPPFKFNNVLNKHFPLLIFSKSILLRKNKRGEGEYLLFKNGTINSYPYYNHAIVRAGLTFRGAPSTLRIFATSSCQIKIKIKKKGYARGPGTVP